MDQNKLSNNEELVLRLLYSGHLDSKNIPEVFFGPEEKENLIGLGLLEMQGSGKYILTDKALETLETGGFIVKYPLYNEQGVVMNFVDILNSYSKDALRALGMSIINTESYKRWGRHNNLALFKLLKETINYYDSFSHPLSKLDTAREYIIEAQSNYEKTLLVELAKIAPFKLLKPVILGTHSNGTPIRLIEFVSDKEGVVREGALEVNISFDDPQYRLTSHMMHQIIRQFYVVKSKATQVAIVEQK
jgi:hypothetical protein